MLKFTDVKPMIQRKIIRNELAQNLLKSHVEIFEKEMEIRKVYISSCGAKIQLLDIMTSIEKMQLDEYDKDRETAVLETSASMDEMDEDLIKDISKMQEDIKKIKESSRCITEQIKYLNGTIPSEGFATNYKIKYKDSLGGRCIP